MTRFWLPGWLSCASAGLMLLAFANPAQARPSASDAARAAVADPVQNAKPAAPANPGAPAGQAQAPAAGGAAAQRPAASPVANVPLTGKIACVNVIHVLNEYQRQRDLLEEIAKYSEKLQAEDTRRKQEIDKLQAELERVDPNDPTAVPRVRQLLQQQIEYKNWQDMKRMDTARELGLWSMRIYADLQRAVEDVAKRDGYDMVFYKGEFERVSMDPEAIKDQIRGLHLLYNHPALEITQAVLDKLNGDYRAQPRTQMLMQNTP